METKNSPRPRQFAGLVEAATARNISRSVAFDLAAKGMLETFKLGQRRYVFLDSLDTLGTRLVAQTATQEAEA